MKKLLCMAMLCITLCVCMAGTAFAVKPGETATVTISATNTGGAYTATIGFSYDKSLFTLTATSGSSGFIAPPVTGGGFAYMSFSAPFSSGTVGTLTFTVSEDAEPDTYPISAYKIEAIDLEGNPVDISVSGGSITVDPPCSHEWGAWTTTKEATCSAKGTKERTCSLCSKTETADIETIDHTWGEWKVDTEPTCEMNGTKVRECTVCGADDAQPIPTEGHQWSTWTETAATCTEDGQKTRTCSVCKDTETQTTETKLGHAWDEGTVTKAPTCSATGVKTYTCTRDASHTNDETLKKVSHNYTGDGDVTKEPTCTEQGVRTWYCTYECGTKKTESIAANGHTKGEDAVVVEPTCTTAGSESYVCTVCGTKISGKVLAKLGHDMDADWTVTKEPTCTKKGEKVKYCSRCDYTQTQAINATGKHIYAEEGTVTKEPTCTTAGTMSYTCTYEGCTKAKTETIAKLGHDWDEGTVTKEPTCTKAGTKTVTCKRDSSHITTQSIPATGHTKSEDAVIVAPTCTQAGSASYVCSVCGTKISGQKIPATGHDWDEGTVTKAPTCTEAGKVTYTCKNDASHTKTGTLKALGHSWVVDVPATKTEDGTKHCDACGVTAVIKCSTYYNMTVSSLGIRFRDLENPITNDWYMFTPVDLSVEGEQTFDLVAGNRHYIGTATLVVEDGNVTVTWKLNNSWGINVHSEFMTILPSLSSVTELDFDAMTNYPYGEPISIEEDLGGDTKVLLLLHNAVGYNDKTPGISEFGHNSKEYKQYAEELKQLMD